MKIVAARAPKKKKLDKSFTPGEIKEIQAMRSQNELSEYDRLKREENRLRRDKYKRIKQLVREMEAGNKSRVIVFPQLTNGAGWYKVVEFSALYYVYRLSDRMGRSAQIFPDKDKFLKCIHTATFQNIEKFITQFEELEHPKLTITTDGIYIFELPHPLTDEEVGRLRRTEEEWRATMHNQIRPKLMSPATYQQILTLVRQTYPKLNKENMRNYYLVGEDMMKCIVRILAIYFDATCGLIDKVEAGKTLLRETDKFRAGLAVLGEIRSWSSLNIVSTASNLNELRRLIIKDFSLEGRGIK